MKIHQSSLLLQFSALLFHIVLTCLVAYAWVHQINFYKMHWIALVLLLGCLCFKYTDSYKTHSQRNNLINIYLFQLSLYFIHFGISNLFSNNAFTQSIQFNTAYVGLFPWAYMLLIAVILRLTIEHSHKDATIADILCTTFKIKLGGQLWSLLHLSIRQATLMVTALTLALICMGIYASCIGKFDYFSVRGLVLSMMVMILALSKITKKYLPEITTKKALLFIRLPAFAVILGFTLVIIALILTPLASHVVSPPSAMQLFNALFQHANASLLFGQGWWLCWSVIGGCYIAHHSRGLSLRRMILASLLLPFVIGLLMQCSAITTHITSSDTSILFAILGILILLNRLFKPDTLPCYILTQLPVLSTPKKRAYKILLAKALKIMLLLLFFTIPIGSQVFTAGSMLVSIPLLELFIFVMIVVVPVIRHR